MRSAFSIRLLFDRGLYKPFILSFGGRDRMFHVTVSSASDCNVKANKLTW